VPPTLPDDPDVAEPALPLEQAEMTTADVTMAIDPREIRRFGKFFRTNMDVPQVVEVPKAYTNAVD
jgi:hypothetical protein